MSFNIITVVATCGRPQNKIPVMMKFSVGRDALIPPKIISNSTDAQCAPIRVQSINHIILPHRGRWIFPQEKDGRSVTINFIVNRGRAQRLVPTRGYINTENQLKPRGTPRSSSPTLNVGLSPQNPQNPMQGYFSK